MVQANSVLRIFILWSSSRSVSPGRSPHSGISRENTGPIFRPLVGSGWLGQINKVDKCLIFKFFNRFSFYFKLPFRSRFASSTSLGIIGQLTENSTTYPDRLFFLGGQEMRGWYLQSFIPQDDLDRLERDAGTNCDDPARAVPCFTLATAPIRGGNLSAVQRFEVRIPIAGPLETVVFADIGNLWRTLSYPFDQGSFPIRAAAGTGLRIQTPIAPIALDFGYNVTRKRAYEEPFAFSFSLGLF